MFKSANPDSRIPTYLQKNTKENLVWQLKLLVVLIAFFQVKERYELHRDKKKYANL